MGIPRRYTESGTSHQPHPQGYHLLAAAIRAAPALRPHPFGHSTDRPGIVLPNPDGTAGPYPADGSNPPASGMVSRRLGMGRWWTTKTIRGGSQRMLCIVGVEVCSYSREYCAAVLQEGCEKQRKCHVAPICDPRIVGSVSGCCVSKVVAAGSGRLILGAESLSSGTQASKREIWGDITRICLSGVDSR